MASLLQHPKLALPPRHSELINFDDWLAAEDAAELACGAGRVAGGVQPGTMKSKKRRGPGGFEATAVVMGRPTTKRNLELGWIDKALVDKDDDNGLGRVEDNRLALPPVVDLEGKNWVGLLLEYRQAHPTLPSSLERAENIYHEASPSLSLFTCTVTIPERANAPFSGAIPFPRKKDAKQHAAKCAIEWLIANRHMPPVGEGVVWPKARPSAPAMPQATGAARSTADPSSTPRAGTAPSGSPGAGMRRGTGEVEGEGEDDVSTGQKIVSLCTLLGMSPPKYVIVANEEFEGMYSGYASFEMGGTGKIGEFRNVYGRKKAKELCAVMVLEALRGMAERRRERNLLGS